LNKSEDKNMEIFDLFKSEKGKEKEKAKEQAIIEYIQKE